MKLFIFNIFKFFGIFSTLILLTVLLSNTLINNGKFFLTNKNSKYIILGHSHPECAFNDSLIDNLSNFGNSGESYFYTFQKAKKLIENNPQIKTVFIEFSNNQIDKKMDDWIWDDIHILEAYPRYSAVMDFKDTKLLVKKNWETVMASFTRILYNNLLFLSKGKSNFINERWGGYKFLDRNMPDSLVRVSKLRINEIGSQKKQISDVNIAYLLKILAFCKINNVQVYLIRTPVHALYPYLSNEYKFKEILKKRLNNVTFLDFKDYSLKDDEFADLGHLNYKGARKFSKFFNRLIKTGLLVSLNKQQMINTIIKQDVVEN